MNEFPRGTASGDIGERAENILNYHKPAWVRLTKIHQEKDLGLDYRAEFRTPDDQDWLGVECGVQLKGSVTVPDGQQPEVRVSTSTVRYWNYKPYPTLIIHVQCDTEAIRARLYRGESEPPAGQATMSFAVVDALSWVTVRDTLVDLYSTSDMRVRFRNRIIMRDVLQGLSLVFLFVNHTWHNLAIGLISFADTEADWYGPGCDPLNKLLLFFPIFIEGSRNDLEYLMANVESLATPIAELYDSHSKLGFFGSSEPFGSMSGAPQIAFVSKENIRDAFIHILLRLRLFEPKKGVLVSN